ncbi:clasp N terminal-domain-containing protein [Myxozyma melibiosi]|uniref:Protein STU1 n=1 Tax=Myxozyma melibiosi TaxID=54550 RepID=A0ABR1FDU9_9ASCO
MSLSDANILQSEFDKVHIDYEKLVNKLAEIRHDLKHQPVEIKAVDIFFDYFVKGMFHEDIRISQYSFGCICHLVKRLYFQEPSRLRRYANQVVPVLLEKLPERNKIHDVASKALMDYWRASSIDVERCLRISGFLNDRSEVREQTLIFLCTLQETEPKFIVRGLLFDIVSALKDSDPKVQETCRESILTLYRNGSLQALFDLKTELVNQHIPTEVSNDILSKLGVDIPTPDSSYSQSSGSLLSSSTNSSQRLSRPKSAQDETANLTNTTTATGPTVGATKRTPLAVIPDKADENRSIPNYVSPTAPLHQSSPAIPEPAMLFIKQIPGTAMEDLKPVYATSARDLELLMEAMVKHFDGKETEANWAERQKSVVTLRGLLRGNAFTDYAVEFITSLRPLVDGIIKAVSSLRTTLSTHGCKLISDLANVTGSAIDPFVDGFVQTLVKLSAATKKISGQNANASLVVLIAYTSFHQRVASHICGACRDKNAPARLFGAGWLQLLLMVHKDQKATMEASNCVELFEASIKSGLGDANPKVRECMRTTFWEFDTLWPSHSAVIMNNLDQMARKALEKVNPNASSGASSSASSISGSSGKPAASRPRVSAVAKAIMEAKQKQAAQAQAKGVKPAVRGLDKPAVNMAKAN